jgi:hypothetical protein
LMRLQNGPDAMCLLTPEITGATLAACAITTPNA